MRILQQRHLIHFRGHQSASTGGIHLDAAKTAGSPLTPAGPVIIDSASIELGICDVSQAVPQQIEGED